MENQALQVAVNLSTKVLDKVVLKWAFSKKILPSYEELEKFKKDKINYFAGYLFPELPHEDLEWIMKMFLWLFALDDIMDIKSRSEIRSFIWALRTKSQLNYLPPYSYLYKSYQELVNHLPGKDNVDWQVSWYRHWSSFLNGVEWELDNKYYEKVPDLHQYRYYRPHLSGVFLALHYLKLNLEIVPSCISELLENKIARWICLCNDFISADKEEKAGDFHNELFLLSRIISKREAKRMIEREISLLQRHIQHLEQEILKEYPEYKDWISGLNLLMGGCAFWSNEVTLRYGTYLNGVSQT